MDILINTSLITAFVAGIAALFAPCCITVLLPAYLASIFKQKKKVFFMTFVFFLGIFLVFLPLGLGFGWFGRLINQFHGHYLLRACFGRGLGLIRSAGFHILGNDVRLNLRFRHGDTFVCYIFIFR